MSTEVLHNKTTDIARYCLKQIKKNRCPFRRRDDHKCQKSDINANTDISRLPPAKHQDDKRPALWRSSVMSAERTDGRAVRRKSSKVSPSTSSIYQITYKVLLLGDSGVGKTALVRALRGDDFLDSLMSTIGIDFVNSFFNVGGVRTRLQVWDTAGQERFRTITRSHYRGCKGLILAFDITDRRSFNHLNIWYKELEQIGVDEEIIMMVGNKSDLEHEREVTTEEAQNFAESHCMKYVETSCKENLNVTDLFEQLALDIVDKNNPDLMPVYTMSLAEKKEQAEKERKQQKETKQRQDQRQNSNDSSSSTIRLPKSSKEAVPKRFQATCVKCSS